MLFAALSILLLFSSLKNLPAQENVRSLDVDLNTTHQTIEGFGTCLITFKDYPPEYKDPEFLDMVVNDLGLSLMRIPVMEHTEMVNDDEDPDHFNWSGFYTQNNHRRKGFEETMELLEAFKKQGLERFMATPWSPPGFMKTNRAPIQGGHLRADMTDELAEYLAAYIMMAKKNHGIDLNWMSIQNELLFAQFYRSCVYQPYILREAVRAVEQKFKEHNINTQILMPEDMMFPHRMLMYIDPTMNDPETKDFNGHFSSHSKAEKEGLRQWVDSTKQYNRQNWMTETSGHNPTWQGAFKMAEDMHTYLVDGNFSAWVYWQLSGGNKENAKDQGKYTLLIQGEPTPKYYAAKHFYRYIRPGAIRVNANTKSDSLLVSAFKHPVKGSLTFVLINQQEEETSIQFNSESPGLPRTFDVYCSTESGLFEGKNNLSRDEVLKIPGNSITTLYGTSDQLKNRKKTELSESWEIPSDAKEEKWGNDKNLNIEKEWQRLPDGSQSMIKEAEELVNNNAVNKARHNGWTLLHDAILQGDGRTIEYLLENGVNVNASANDGWTPMHAAASVFSGNEDYSRYDIFQLILQANPDLQAKTNDGWTPLHAAVTNAYAGWRQRKSTPVNRVDDLIQAGADVNTKDVNGRTPLHWAAWQGFSHYTNGTHQIEPDVADVLIKHGARINIEDNNGRTPLHYASEMGYEQIVWALMQAGADKKAKDNNRQTPLDLAKTRELENVIHILKKEELPAHLSETTRDQGQDSGKHGQELVDAAWNGNIEKVKKLLEKGADVDFIDSDGFKAIDRARDNGHDEIVRMLEKAEAENK
ncbi:MAG: ankyrin repeat domain-containing protein [Marinilabiliaceae bacterium]